VGRVGFATGCVLCAVDQHRACQQSTGQPAWSHRQSTNQSPPPNPNKHTHRSLTMGADPGATAKGGKGRRRAAGGDDDLPPGFGGAAGGDWGAEDDEQEWGAGGGGGDGDR